MKQAAPPLTVLMPAYNAAAHLAEAVESVLGQSFGDFELLVVDDGSRDATPRLLAAYAKRDKRVKLRRQPRNLGVAATAQHGYRAARGRYIARMDADDICEPDRLEKQWRYLQRHPEVCVLGTWLRSFGAHEGVLRLPWRHEDILCEAPFQNPLAHPSVMMDRQRLPGLPKFRKGYRAEDYDLWSRWLRQGLRMAALPEPLLRYRLHSAQVSRGDAIEQSAWKVRCDWLEALDLTPGPEEAALHQELCLGRAQGQDAMAVARWARRVEEAGLSYGMPPAAWRRRIQLFRLGAGRSLRRLLALAADGPAAWRYEFERAWTRWAV